MRLSWGLACLLAASLAYAEPSLEVAGTQTDSEALTIDWFLSGQVSGRPKAAAILVGDRPIESAKIQLPPDENLPLCYLFLVDTSESMGRAIEKSVQPFLQAVVTARPERHYYGLGRFDSTLKILADPTRDDAKLMEALKDIKLHGSRTELYRSLIAGVKQLRGCPGYRKVMVVLSDGGAEDVAYKVEDAVNAAKEAHIAIVTIGYYDSIRLQNLAKLSEGTGGGHLPLGNVDKPLQYGEAKTLFQKTDTGGRVRIAFDELPEFASGAKQLILRVTTATDVVLEQPVKVELPEVSAGHLAFLSRVFPWLPAQVTLWVLVFALCILGLGALLLRRPKIPAAGPGPSARNLPTAGATVRVEHPVPPTVAAGRTPDMATVRAAPPTAGTQSIARIEHAAGSLEITATPCTIGALRDNALQINDDSVSRYHAVLDCRDGRYYISDRGSANGTYINRNKVQHAEVKNGDQLRFGTWEGTFRTG